MNETHGVPSDFPPRCWDFVQMVPCPTCRAAWAANVTGTCPRCRRLTAVGRIVAALNDGRDYSVLGNHVRESTFLDALDAVADLLTDHANTEQDHQKAIREWEHDMNEAGRDGYSAGVEAGRQDAERW